MADLPSGSTIGGERIIHKGIANKHRHDASEIQGLSAIGQPGGGGGIDADVLSGKTYTDLSNEFVRTSNDNVSNLILNGAISNISNAAPLSYLIDNISDDIKSGNFCGITSIGDLSQETFSFNTGQYTVSFDEMTVLINGSKYRSQQQTVDVRVITNNYLNKVFYFYIDVISVNENVEIVATETRIPNTQSSIFIGEAIVDSNGVSFNPIEGPERIGVGKYMLSQTPKPYSIVVSDDSGKIPMGWIPGGSGTRTINLLGPATITSASSSLYRITNYNTFSDYNFSVDLGQISRIDDDLYEYISPNTSPNGDLVHLTVSKDGYERNLNINIEPDPDITLSGPSNISTSGNGNTSYVEYVIGNNNPYYTYTVSVSVTGVSVYQQNGNQVILEVPPTNPYNQTGVLEVSRTGSSAAMTITFEADPNIELSGPSEVLENNTEYFTIENYNSGYTYTHTSTTGSTSQSGNTIIYNAPDVSSDTSSSIVVSRTGSSYTHDITVLDDDNN